MTSKLIDVEELAYKVRGQQILYVPALSVEEGEVVAVYGRTRTGKSTLGLLLAQWLPVGLPPGTAALLSPQWSYVCGERSARHFHAPLPAMVLTQNPLESLAFPSVREALASVSKSRSEILEALRLVGLASTVLDHELFALSGGMLQRLALTRALLVRPKLLVADCLFDWLDSPGQAVFHEVLAAVRDHGGAAIALHSSHSRIGGVSRILQLKRDDLIELSEPAEMFSGLEGFTPPPLDNNSSALSVRSLSKSYPSVPQPHAVLRSIDLDLLAGEWLGLCGHNGSGKSVLGRVLAGLETEDTGSVMLGRTALRKAQRRSAIAYLFQIPQLQFVAPEVGAGLRTFCGRACTSALALIQKYDPAIKERTKVFKLTATQLRLVILAILALRRPAAVVVDEPTWGADVTEIPVLLRFLREEFPSPANVLVISHDQHLLCHVCNTQLLLRDGALRPLGEPGEWLT